MRSVWLRVWSCAGCTAAAVHWVGWWCIPAALALAARWAAAVVVVVVGCGTAVVDVLLVMVPCTAVINILVAVPRRVGWWCTPDAVVLAARWSAAVVVLVVGRAVAVYELALAMVVCTAVMDIFFAAPRLVGVMWSTM